MWNEEITNEVTCTPFFYFQLDNSKNPKRKALKRETEGFYTTLPHYNIEKLSQSRKRKQKEFLETRESNRRRMRKLDFFLAFKKHSFGKNRPKFFEKGWRNWNFFCTICENIFFRKIHPKFLNTLHFLVKVSGGKFMGRIFKCLTDGERREKKNNKPWFKARATCVSNWFSNI